jgi:hypothetical protein
MLRWYNIGGRWIDDSGALMGWQGQETAEWQGQETTEWQGQEVTEWHRVESVTVLLLPPKIPGSGLICMYYVCMYVCMHACMHALYTYVCMCVCMYIYIHVCIIYVCMYVCTYVSLCTRTVLDNLHTLCCTICYAATSTLPNSMPSTFSSCYFRSDIPHDIFCSPVSICLSSYLDFYLHRIKTSEGSTAWKRVRIF